MYIYVQDMNGSNSFSTKSTLRKGTAKPTTKDYKALIAEDEVMRNYSSTAQTGMYMYVCMYTYIYIYVYIKR
jgi:hypothetical protein